MCEEYHVNHITCEQANAIHPFSLSGTQHQKL